MTQDNNTTYRKKGRAVFLVAIMVMSVFAMSVAFTGSVAAEQRQTINNYNDDGGPLNGSLIYQGQRFGTTTVNTTTVNPGDTWYLVEETGDQSSVEYNTEREITNNGGTLQIDTEGLDGRYVVSKSANGNSESVEAFTVREQTLTTNWDADSLDQRDADAVLEIDDNRNALSGRNISVRADGLDYDQLVDIFAYNDTAGNVVVENEDYLPYNTIPELSEDDRGDGLSGVKDEDVLTLNLTAMENQTNGAAGSASYDDGADEILANFKNLANGEGLPDDGDYEFEFFVTDTTATDTASVNIAETDPDVEFEDSTVVEAGAGDIATMEFTFEDTSSGYLQIGGADVDFVDVLYVEADDASEPVTIRMNTRTAGANESTEYVYDETENVENLVSANHDGYSELNDTRSEAASFFVDGDGDRLPGTNPYAGYLEELGILDTNTPSGNADYVGAAQLTRPMQAAEYDLTFGADLAGEDGIFEADGGSSEAIVQMNTGLLQLNQPEVGDITTHVAPGDDADSEESVDRILNNISTQRQDLAINDRLIIQVEATGLYGTLVNESGEGFALVDDGESAPIGALGSVTEADDGGVSQGISFSLEADSTVGNQDPTSLNLSNTASNEAALVVDNDNGQFFVIVDTSEADAFDNGDPLDGETYTAEFEYDADTDADRYKFNQTGNGYNQKAFDKDSQSDLYPYFTDDRTATTTQTVSMETAEINFDNLDEDSNVQVQQSESAEISGTTNVAPGSDAEIQVRSTAASSSFRRGNTVEISEDGSVTTEFDFSNQQVGDEFDSVLRIGGSAVDSQPSVLVEAVGASGDDGEETNETDTDDGEEMNETDEPADDGEMNETTDDGESESTDDGTPGFGAVVALIALIGAALLAVRRQN